MPDDYLIEAEDLHIGENVVIQPGVTITGWGDEPLQRLVIGDDAFIGHDTTIRVPELEIGDYTKIHNHSLISGPAATTIGHNGWFGQNTILNSTDPLTIGDNCGVGAYSQLWTHILYGDVMEGCRFDSTKPMAIGKDVWFVGHCIVSPIVAADRSMAMVGSVVTKDMQENHIYAGAPAKDITDKVGPQFVARPVAEKLEYLERRLAEFLEQNPDADPAAIGIAASGDVLRDGESLFDVADRTYSKTRSASEVAFMHHLLPRAKFTPRS